MSKTSQRIESSKKYAKEMFKSGFDDAVSGYGFRWRRHPKMNNYKLGYRKGKALLRNKMHTKPASASKSVKYYATLATVSTVLYTLVIYTAIDKGWF